MTIERLQLKLASLEMVLLDRCPSKENLHKMSHLVSRQFKILCGSLDSYEKPSTLRGTTHESEEGVNRGKWQLKVRV